MELKRLPSNFEVAEYLFSKATQPKSDKMNTEISNYSKMLIDLWCKSFGKGHNLSLTPVKHRVRKLINEYYKEVYVKAHQKKKKHTENCSCAGCTSGIRSQRQLERRWKAKNNELFDIGCKMDELEGDEKLFYKDQKSRKIGQLDDKIDEQYEEEQELLRQTEQAQLLRDQLEEDFIMQPIEENEQEDAEDPMNSTINNTSNLGSSFNR
jgi:hypothetical protein